MNKNVVISILVVLIFIGGIWGSLADRKRIALEKKLENTVEQMEKMTKQSNQQREHVLGKTADLQQTLVDKEEQLNKARKELVTLRKEIKTIEAQLSGCNADIQKLTQEKEALAGKNSEAQNSGTQEQETESSPGAADSSSTSNNSGEEQANGQVHETVQSLQEKLHTAELTIDKLRQRVNGANAQMMGLEKLLEEKNAAMEETSQDMDRLRINMDVLLSKIADQRDQLQEIQEENRDLVKEIAVKNEEIADLQEEVIRQPVQE